MNRIGMESGEARDARHAKDKAGHVPGGGLLPSFSAFPTPIPHLGGRIHRGRQGLACAGPCGRKEGLMNTRWRA